MTWTAKYEVVRSGRDPALHIIYVDGTFSEIPDRDRKLGPWQPLATGNIANLKPQYRVRIATEGYIMVRHTNGTFSAEPRVSTRSRSSSTTNRTSVRTSRSR